MNDFTVVKQYSIYLIKNVFFGVLQYVHGTVERKPTIRKI